MCSGYGTSTTSFAFHSPILSRFFPERKRCFRMYGQIRKSIVCGIGAGTPTWWSSVTDYSSPLFMNEWCIDLCRRIFRVLPDIWSYNETPEICTNLLHAIHEKMQAQLIRYLGSGTNETLESPTWRIKSLPSKRYTLPTHSSLLPDQMPVGVDPKARRRP